MWSSVSRVFDRVVADYADRTAIIDGERTLSYAQMGAFANRVANGLLDVGVSKGDRVGLLMPNSAEFIPTMFGIWKSGAAITQMPTRAGADDFRFYLGEVGASTLIHHAAFDEAVAKIRPELPELTRVIRLGDEQDAPADTLTFQNWLDAASAEPPAADVKPDDLAFVGFTSGSTGVPKGVVLDHERWAHYAITAGLEIAQPQPGEVFVHVAPLTHFTQHFVVPTMVRGGVNVVLPGFDIDLLLGAIERTKATGVALVPTIVYMLLDHPKLADYDISSLRTIAYAGSPIAPERLKQALEVFGPVFVQAYAGSEPGYVSCLRKEDHATDEQGLRRLASAGRPLMHVDVSIQDEQDQELPRGEVGEICVRSAGQMKGYWDASKNAEAMRDGWVHSGDMGRLDEDGYLYIVDRKKDMVISGGFNVFPKQVEDVLAEHPAVAQSAVFGVPDPKWGEAVKAVVVLRPGASATADELMALVKERKGAVFTPKSIDFVDALPVNPAGKVDKKTLRAPYWADAARQVN